MARPPTEVDAREVYHALCPLAPLSPVPRASSPSSIAEQEANEAAYRQLLVQGVLALLLPTEDLQNECLTSLVSQIFSELIIGNIIANRASQPWLIWEGLSILAGVIRRRGRPSRDPGGVSATSTSFPPPPPPPPKSPSSSAPTASGRVRGKANVSGQEGRLGVSLQRILLTMLHWVLLAFSTLRILITTVAMSSGLPRRTAGRFTTDKSNETTTSHKPKEKGPLLTGHNDGSERTNGETRNSDDARQPVKVPILSFRIWGCISNLAELELRMPWLAGAMAMLQLAATRGPGQIGGLDGIIDR